MIIKVKGKNVTFIICINVREGIVMASDSRLTLSRTKEIEEKKVIQMAVGQSDSNNKTFLTPNNVGISAFGAADINGNPISGYIDSFISEHLSQNNCDAVDEIPNELLTYFKNLPGPPKTGFLVAGYKKIENRYEQQIWQVSIPQNSINRLNKPGISGALWRGESDVMRRLLLPVFIQKDGKYLPVPNFPIQFRFFTLQDAIDYSLYAVKTTIDTMRFHPRPKTVGGPVDILVIKPNEAFWVKKKELHS
jgi:hypothetical protein